MQKTIKSGGKRTKNLFIFKSALKISFKQYWKLHDFVSVLLLLDSIGNGVLIMRIRREVVVFNEKSS